MKRIVILISVLCLAACKKQLPQPDTTPPVFNFHGIVNGASLDLEAGVSDYFMYSTYYHNTNAVYTFDSHLKKFNCTNCINDIQILINDYQTSANGSSVNMNNSISPGYFAYDIPGGGSISTTVNFNSNVTGPVTNYNWDFGDGSTATTTVSNTSHTYARHGKFNVCLTVNFSGGQTSSICNEINVEIPDNAIDYLFSATAGAGTSVTFNPVAQNGSAVSYLWDLGDGTSSNSSTSFNHTYSLAGVYTVRLTVTDASGHTSGFSRNVKTAGMVVPTLNFFDAVSSSTIANPLSLSNVTINYTDANGLIWTSNNSGGQSGMFFKVLSVDDYKDNENGQATKKVTAAFNCNLYNGSSSITLNNGNVVFAFAYPR